MCVVIRVNRLINFIYLSHISTTHIFFYIAELVHIDILLLCSWSLERKIKESSHLIYEMPSNTSSMRRKLKNNVVFFSETQTLDSTFIENEKSSLESIT